MESSCLGNCENNSSVAGFLITNAQTVIQDDLVKCLP